jgi:polar amino acid transport system permease protein
MVWVLALAPTAQAAGPIVVTDALPKANMTTVWGGNTVSIFYRSPMDDQLDPARCKLFVDGKPIDTGLPINSGQGALINGKNTFQGYLQFNLPSGFSVANNKQSTFKVTLVSIKGETLDHQWQFSSSGATTEKPGLINFHRAEQWFGYIATGAIDTVELTLISMVLAVVFALFGSLGRLAKKMTYRQAWDRYRSGKYMLNHTLRMIPYWLATFYTSIFRGTPLLLQIFVVYEAIPTFILFMRARWSVWNSVPYPSAFVSGVAALSLNYGAYLTEVFRAGIQAVPKGQTEASWALGLNGAQTQRRIILPQAFKIVIPAVGNDFIALIKDTSLVSTITVAEILHRAQLVGGRYYDFLSPLLDAAVVYWLLTIFFSFWQAKLERKMERDRARA